MEEKKVVVLIVNDDNSTREIYREVFGWAGFEVLEAINGEVAYDMIKDHRPDVVFTGIEMPKMGGFTLVKKIRQLRKDIPKIIINSHTDKSEDRETAEALGVDGYFVRGFSAPRNVVNRINTLLGRKGLPGGKVLIVDDDVSTRQTYKEVLRWAGFDVYEAENGKEALAMVEQTIPDVIFTGIQMPQMDGFELIRRIRRNFEPQPFIIVSSHNDDESNRKKAASLGVDGYFVRGFSSTKNLVAHIRKLLSGPVKSPKKKYLGIMLNTKEAIPGRMSVIYMLIFISVAFCFAFAVLYYQNQFLTQEIQKSTMSQPKNKTASAWDTTSAPRSVSILTGNVVRIENETVVLRVYLDRKNPTDIHAKIPESLRGDIPKYMGTSDEKTEKIRLESVQIGDRITITLKNPVPVDALSEVSDIQDIAVSIPSSQE